MARVTVLVRSKRVDLIEAIAIWVTDNWHPDYTLPRIYALAAADRNLVDGIGRMVARVASQHGVIAPVYNLADRSPGLEPTCKHRFGITDLPLDDASLTSDVLFAIAPWTRVAPRSRRWLMRISPQLDLDVVINAEAANPVLLFQVGSFGGNWFAVVADDLIAAEVVGRAMRAVACPDEWDGINPWQQPLVQIGMERNLGIRGPESLHIEVDSDFTFDASALSPVIEAAAMLLAVQVEHQAWVDLSGAEASVTRP